VDRRDSSRQLRTRMCRMVVRRKGMVWIPGGEFSTGANVGGGGSCEMPMASNDAGPVHRVRVDGFWMDKIAVTNGQFEEFVRSTGYVTIAERTPTKEEFPDAPVENLVAGSVVFTPTEHEVPLDNHYQWWSYVKGANWRHPLRGWTASSSTSSRAA
jgi:formylglycine-generating enzyme